MQVKYRAGFLFEYSPPSGNKKRDWKTRYIYQIDLLNFLNKIIQQYIEMVDFKTL